MAHAILSSYGSYGGEVAFGCTVEERPLKVRPEGVARFRLLIVDDEVRLARSLAALLSSHEVLVASSVEEALAQLEKRSFDCILCDLMMPSLSGMDLHAELARRGRGDERRMIFMTGGAFTPRAREFVASVPNHVLEKPFSADSVETLVASLIAGDP